MTVVSLHNLFPSEHSRKDPEELCVLISEERLEWVRMSCERFFEKMREIDALVPWVELN